MGGPQLPQALRVSEAIRASASGVPIIWGGYFPTIFPEAALAEECVDFAIRAQGEARPARSCLMRSIAGSDMARNFPASRGFRGSAMAASCTTRIGPSPAHNRAQQLDFNRFDNPGQYLGHTCLGRRTAGLSGISRLPIPLHVLRRRDDVPWQDRSCRQATRLDRDLTFLSQHARRGLDPVLRSQFLRSRSRHAAAARGARAPRLPWWCYARSDALVNLSAAKLGAGAEEPSAHGLHRC